MGVSLIMKRVVNSYQRKPGNTVLAISWFVRGRIKEKIDIIYAIKHQVYCIANTAQWSANTVLLY